MKEKDDLANRTLIISLVAAPLISLSFLFVGHPRWALAFLTGSGLSIFSMITIMLVVRALMYPGASPRVSALLNITLWMKLPIFGAGLYFIGLLYSAKYTEALFISLAGLCLIPALLTGKAIRDVARDMIADRKREKSQRSSSDFEANEARLSKRTPKNRLANESQFTHSRTCEPMTAAELAGKGG